MRVTFSDRGEMNKNNFSGRNRAQGWQFAKISGHTNETEFGSQLESDLELQSALFTLKYPSDSFPTERPSVNVDGALQVESVLGDLITSKIDAEIVWPNNKRVSISIKKSNAGQVWLVPVSRFIRALGVHGLRVPIEAENALRLFIGGSNLQGLEADYMQGLNTEKSINERNYIQEIHQQRLLAASIVREFPTYWNSLISFLRENSGLFTDLMFSRGLAKRPEDSADLVIYNNVQGSANVFKVESLVVAATSSTSLARISAGPRNGGSTIYLPTGFLQMHHPQGENLMQFHHKYEKVASILSDAT
jgi:hypothetical protein